MKIGFNNTSSLFLEVANERRKCSDLDIENFLCCCIKWIDIPEEEIYSYKPISILANMAIQVINRQSEIDYNCKNVTLHKILSAKEHQLKGEIYQNRNLTIEISIAEDKNAILEIKGFMAESEKEFKKFIIEEYNPDYPIEKFEMIYNETPFQMKLQIHEIKRKDTQTTCGDTQLCFC